MGILFRSRDRFGDFALSRRQKREPCAIFSVQVNPRGRLFLHLIDLERFLTVSERSDESLSLGDKNANPVRSLVFKLTLEGDCFFIWSMLRVITFSQQLQLSGTIVSSTECGQSASRNTKVISSILNLMFEISSPIASRLCMRIVPSVQQLSICRVSAYSPAEPSLSPKSALGTAISPTKP